MREKEERENPPHVPTLAPLTENTPTALKAQSETPSHSQTPVVQANSKAIKTPWRPLRLIPLLHVRKVGPFKEVTENIPLGQPQKISEIIPLKVPRVPYSVSQPQQFERDEVFIPITKEQYLDLVKPWNEAIICKMVERSFSQDFLKKELHKL